MAIRRKLHNVYTSIDLNNLHSMADGISNPTPVTSPKPTSPHYQPHRFSKGGCAKVNSFPLSEKWLILSRSGDLLVQLWFSGLRTSSTNRLSQVASRDRTTAGS